MRHPGPQEVGQEINDERMQPDNAKWHKKEGNKEELLRTEYKAEKAGSAPHRDEPLQNKI